MVENWGGEIGTMVILMVIDDGVYLCICKVYSSVFKEYTQHAFIYDIHFLQWYNSVWCGAIIDNRSYATISVLEEKDRKSKTALNNMLMKFFEDMFIAEYDFKVTTNSF